MKSVRCALPASRTPSGAARLLLLAAITLSAVLGVQAVRAPVAVAAPHAGPASPPPATGPTVVDDVGGLSLSGGEISLPGATDDLAGSVPIRADLTVFPADQLASLPAGSSILNDGHFIGYAGFGNFVLEDGRIRFLPGGETGRKSVRYRITDANGASDEGLVTVTVWAGGEFDIIDAAQGTATTVDLLANDTPGRNADGSPGALDRSSVRFPTDQPRPVTVLEDGRELTYPGVGSFTLDPVTGLVTFAPDPAYVSPYVGRVVYSAQDTTLAADGTREHHAYKNDFIWRVTRVTRLSIDQTVSSSGFAQAGQVLTWKASLRNVSMLPLVELRVSDAPATRVSARSCSPVPLGGTLAPGASTTCTATSTIRQQDLDEDATLRDTVTATATTSQAGQSLTTTATASASSTPLQHQRLSLSATARPTTVSQVGQTVGYTFVAENKGNVSLNHLMVSDPSPGLSALVCSPVAEGGTLGPAQSTTCRAARTTTPADLRKPTLADVARATATPLPINHARAANATGSVTVAVRALPPRPTDDVAPAVASGPDVVLPAASNDLPGESGGPAIDPSRTVFVVAQPSAAYDGKQVADESGLWSTRPDGSVLLRLGPHPAGYEARINYRVYDTAGHSSVGRLRVPVRPGPTAATHHATTPQGQPVTLDVLGVDDPGQNADETPSTFDRSSLQLSSPWPFSSTYAVDGKHLDVPGVGDYTAGADGRITFVPAVGFVGTPPTLSYVARSTAGGHLSGMLDVVVTRTDGGPPPPAHLLPVATDDHAVTTTQIPAVLTAQRDDRPGASPFDNSKLTFPGDQLPRLPAGSTIVYRDGVTLTVPGQGTYRARWNDQDVVFTPARGFTGSTTPVEYRVADVAGNTARATLTVTVLPGVTARPDVASTSQGQAVTVDVLANDDHGPSPSTWTAEPASGSPQLTTTGHPGAILTRPFREKLTVPGEGVYTVSPGDGEVTFQPDPGFTGVSSVRLALIDKVTRPSVGSELVELSSTLQVTVRASAPSAAPDRGSTTVGQPVVVAVLANDRPGSPDVPLVGASVRLRLTSDLPARSVLYGDAKTLVVAGRGTFLVAGDGEITFVPLGTTTGPVPPVGYQVADAAGSTVRSTLTTEVH